ncbi:NAD(P)/FAD-dependent oxidoreductase [Candidatus Woesearchaeota archaeon]|nr:NAD(P)/FAD-dependent oxidoreductase [Candidatus Woesearchaeota archaeon]
MKITVIGGGPIGCYTASLLSKDNEVTLYEEKKEVGLPIQCTGILSDTIHEIIPIKKDFVANKIWSTRVYSPNNKFLRIDFKKPNIIIYRNKFDQHFRDRALKNGAKIVHKHRFTGKKEVLSLETRKKKKIDYKMLIGADGPLSKVSELNGLGKRKYLQGVQALIKKKNDNVIDFYPHIGTYAWAVPQTEDVLRVGVATEKNAMKIFKEFSKRYKGKLLGWQGGLIPLHNPKLQTAKNNVYLVGDAAAQIKNTTGGGLIPGLISAEELKKAIDNDLDYDKLWRKRIGKSLWTHYFVRNIMNNFDDDDWNRLIQLFNKKSMKHILATESRDKPIRILTKAILRNPSMLKFFKKIF